MAGHSAALDRYNAADDLIGRNLEAGRGDKPAFVDADGAMTYAELDRAANRFANLLRAEGVRMEERVLLCMLDTTAWPVCFLGAIRAGAVPIPVNTRLTAGDYAFMLEDSRARMLVVSEPLMPAFADHLDGHDALKTVLVDGADGGGHPLLSNALAAQSDTFETAPTRAGDMCFWLYTSGTTGKPKGAVHLQTHLIETANLYAIPTLGISSEDVCFSAAKLFFAYGLGNGLTFPMAVGATTFLHAGPPDPESVCDILKTRRPTIFYGVPTLYGMLLASGKLPGPGEHSVRIATSAGEALPAELLRRFKKTTGIDILDGLGSTEMLHIFLSNRVDDITPGASGRPVAGLRSTPRRRRRTGDRGRRRDGHAGGLRPDRGRHVLEPARQEHRDLPGSLDAYGRQICPRRERCLRPCRPLRRHVEGRRHLRLAGRGGGRHRPPREGAGGRGRRACRRGRSHQAQGLRRARRGGRRPPTISPTRSRPS
jgi:benzoate-CoA ligase family protein